MRNNVEEEVVTHYAPVLNFFLKCRKTNDITGVSKIATRKRQFD